MRSTHDLARLDAMEGKLAEAERLCRQALAAREGRHVDRHDDPAEVRAHFAALLRRTGRTAEADEREKAIQDTR